MIKHIVLWTLKNKHQGKAKMDLAMEMKSRLEELKNEIKEIQKLEVGINDSNAPESNYDICLVIDFESIEGLKAYQTHPAHLGFMAYVKTVRNERVAIDYKY